MTSRSRCPSPTRQPITRLRSRPETLLASPKNVITLHPRVPVQTRPAVTVTVTDKDGITTDFA